MLVLIIFYSFSLNLINKYSRMDFSDINTRLIEPNTGWDVYTQKNLNELIDRIGYYQPTYLPNNFVKNYDTANNTFSIMTVYSSKSVINRSSYSSLVLEQYPIDEAKAHFNSYISDSGDFNLQEDKLSENTKYYELIETGTDSLHYFETTPRPLDPYFASSFSGSKDEQMMRNSVDRHMVLIKQESVLELNLGFGYEIDREATIKILKDIMTSLVKVDVTKQANLNSKDLAIIDFDITSAEAWKIVYALDAYKNEKGDYPWNLSNTCNNGKEPNKVNASSNEFSSCLDVLLPYTPYQKPFNEKYLSYITIIAGETENFSHISKNNSNNIYKSYTPRACFKPTSLGEYEQKSARSGNYIDEYPMYTNEAKINLDCMAKPFEKECFTCRTSIK